MPTMECRTSGTWSSISEKPIHTPPVHLAIEEDQWGPRIFSALLEQESASPEESLKCGEVKSVSAATVIYIDYVSNLEQQETPPFRPTVPPSARTLLPSGVIGLADSVSAIVLTKAEQSGLPIKAVDWLIFEDPEEGTRELVLNTIFEATSDQAMAFWDNVGDDLDRMKLRLSEDLRALMDRYLAVEISW